MTHDDLDRDLRQAISELPAPSEGPPASQILARARRRRPWPVYGAGAMLLAAAALLFVLPGTGMRDKGQTRALAVHLEAAAEARQGLRALGPGAEVDLEEGVVFRMSTQGPGALSLVADGVPVWGPQEVTAGTHGPGGQSPQAWRHPGEAGAVVYTAWLCPPGQAPGDSSCSSDHLQLVWRP